MKDLTDIWLPGWQAGEEEEEDGTRQETSAVQQTIRQRCCYVRPQARTELQRPVVNTLCTNRHCAVVWNCRHSPYIKYFVLRLCVNKTPVVIGYIWLLDVVCSLPHVNTINQLVHTTYTKELKLLKKYNATEKHCNWKTLSAEFTLR